MPVSNTAHLSSQGGSPIYNHSANKRFSNGEYDIRFNAYMSSRAGMGRETNSDNYYMNGICVKNFKFDNMVKVINGDIVESGVFAVCSGTSSHRAAKLLMSTVDQNRSMLMSAKSKGQLIKKLASVISACHAELIATGKRDNEACEASLAIAVYKKDYMVYCVCGDAAMVYIKNGRVKKIASQCGNLGSTMCTQLNIGNCTFNSSDRLILLSKGTYVDTPPEEIGYEVVNEPDTQRIVERIINQVSYSNPQDITCLAVAAEPSKGIRTKTIIISGICVLLTLINILLLVLG